jgi:hypothetical protein
MIRWNNSQDEKDSLPLIYYRYIRLYNYHTLTYCRFRIGIFGSVKAEVSLGMFYDYLHSETLTNTSTVHNTRIMLKNMQVLATVHRYCTRMFECSVRAIPSHCTTPP